jgi:hypothetical protein
MKSRLFGNWLQQSTRWGNIAWATLLALVPYTGLALLHGPLWPATRFAYFNYLADAFNHGQLALRLIPASTHDLVFFHGQYYLYWPPLPAALLMPFVALFGVQFSDVLVTVILGVLNVGLVTLLLEEARQQGLIDLTDLQLRLLTLFFALGTVQITLAPYGMVWFTGQLVAFFFVALAYLLALRLHGGPAFFCTGLAMAAAMLTRNHLVLAGLWPAAYLLYQHRAAGWRRLLGYAALGLLPAILAVGLTGLYNAARFGSPLDNGLAYHRMAQVFADDYQRYGAFNLHYVPINFFYQYVTHPFLALPPRRETFMGGGLFWLSPVFLAAFWGLAEARPRWSAWALAGTILLVNIPILTLMGTGEIQFGPRYSLDFTVPLLLLTAMGVRRWPNWLLVLLTALAVLQYVIGAVFIGQVYG